MSGKPWKDLPPSEHRKQSRALAEKTIAKRNEQSLDALVFHGDSYDEIVEQVRHEFLVAATKAAQTAVPKETVDYINGVSDGAGIVVDAIRNAFPAQAAEVFEPKRRKIA